MSKYTPGPWSVWTGDENHVIIAGDDSHGVAMVMLRPEDEHCLGPVETANARLIAAAPDLLEAVNRILLALTENSGDLRADDESLLKARATIAKAVGDE